MTIPARETLNANRRWQYLTARAEYAYDYGMPNWLARADRVAKKLHFERIFLGRHKFCHFRIWYRDRLRDYVNDTLSESALKRFPFLNHKYAARAVQRHLNGSENRTQTLHQLLTLATVDRELLSFPLPSTR